MLLGKTVKNGAARATWLPGFVQSGLRTTVSGFLRRNE
jgi:hypothetical protein